MWLTLAAMDIDAFLKAMLLGLSIAAPVGPIGVLCIRRTLAHGRLTGLVSGLGAATADAIYGLIGGLGLAALSAILVEQRDALQLIGGAFLSALGLRTLLTPGYSAEAADASPARGLFGAYASTLALTLTNPMTILSFAAIFAGLGAAGAGGVPALVAGVFAGSALWWLALSGIVGLLHGRLSPRALTWVNRASGGIMLAFGVLAFGTILLI